MNSFSSMRADQSRPLLLGALRQIALVLTALYMLIVAFMTLWPEHIDNNATGGFIHTLIEQGLANGSLPGWFTYSFVEWLSNVIMFAPGGFALFLLLRKPWRNWVPVFGLCTSVGIETIQLFLPDRTSSLLDVLANSLGAFLGWCCAIVLYGLAKGLRKG